MKFFIIGVIIISTFSAAAIIISNETQHCRNIDTVIRMINDIKNKSLYYAKPFSEIMYELRDNKNYERFILINTFCNNIAAGYPVPEAWGNAVEYNSKYFTADECHQLKCFGEELCNCNREEIPGIADNLISEFHQFRQIATDRRNLKSKSTAAVTISAGLMIVLVFA